MPLPRNYPLEAFNPRFPELLLRGARGEDFTIQCNSASEAYRLQHMLHSYRNRARQQFKDEPERWRPLFTAVVGLAKDDNGKKTRVRIFSRHNEFKDILDAAVGPTVPELDEKPRPDPLDEFFTAKPEGSGE